MGMDGQTCCTCAEDVDELGFHIHTDWLLLCPHHVLIFDTCVFSYPTHRNNILLVWLIMLCFLTTIACTSSQQ
jgi:hypothetical protein